ncbi:MAG: DUF1080 domain-containing protein [Kiritimatiellae bacterium]|nr:DUF1080 domain-containing protein [Kiritimatiellia bacterium]
MSRVRPLAGVWGILAFATVAIAAQTLAPFDLDQWDAFLAEPSARKGDVWSVRDGVLVCRGEPMGYLFTKAVYTNLRLRLEWRWAPGSAPGNSGVLLRINGEPRPLPRSIEVQLKSGDAGALYGFHGMALRGPEDRTFRREGHPMGGTLTGVRKAEAAEKEPGEWNSMEVELRGGILRVMVNGRQVNAAEDCEVVPGPVGLQSEGGEIHFRNVVIEALP